MLGEEEEEKGLWELSVGMGWPIPLMGVNITSQ